MLSAEGAGMLPPLHKAAVITITYSAYFQFENPAVRVQSARSFMASLCSFGNAYVTSERTCLVMWRRQYSAVNVKRAHKGGQKNRLSRDKSKLKDVRVEIFF